ncbi:hypothetical protein FB45DRAFT_916476 [Roridomyces roridus]|uniref:DNA-binding protein RAP1 n=1 Tax=Roridomyces roridus TaxID=1738132 RepID=A0AAD7BUC6_9AGAR|nr:hypothetical protein FB45DRAFT_916476 [Roridomyces roridus]
MIFHDGQCPIKFFLQRDLPAAIHAELCETITSLGGRVEVKVPRQGYILVQSGTSEEGRLRQCWSTPERPERFFVPYTFVEACKIAGTLLKQIFVDAGNPIPMHIHPSIANPNARSALSQRILHSGGDPHASAQSATVILADPTTDVFQHLIKTYESVPNKYIESYLWVKKCIEKNAVVYTPVVFKNPGGRRAGDERTQFTEADEQNLAAWIAVKIPYREAGGRTGNRVYQQLCEQSGDPDYAWVTRHTWQSWRERYKKNAPRFDNIIAGIVEQTKPALGEKGQYHYVRQAEEKPKRTRKKNKPSESEDQFLVCNSRQDDMGTDEIYHLPAEPSMVYPAPAEEEMDEEGIEWAVRVGNSPPPTWAAKGKRRASQELENATKRPRVPTSDEMHVLDHALHEIADSYLFLFSEVKAYYDKTGEMEHTRDRFRRMRELLTREFPDEE